MSKKLLTALLVALVFGSLTATVSPVWTLSTLTEDEMSDISAKDGLIIDFENLDFSIDDITYTDQDGNNTGSTGQIILGSGSAGVTFNDNGSAANLVGLTINADAGIGLGTTATTGGSGGLVVGMPSGTFDINMDEVNFNSNNTFETNINGIDIGNTSFEVGAH